MTDAVRSRIAGIDLAKGLALVGMLAVHVLPAFDADGSASLTAHLAWGRSSAVFATMAGVGLALLTGGPNLYVGSDLVRAGAGLAVRALLIGLIGLLMGYVTAAGNLEVAVILPAYAMMFLLALLFLRLPVTGLFALGGLVAVSGALAINLFVDHVPGVVDGIDPTLGQALAHPIGMPIYLLVGGVYPAALWVCFLLVGLGLGRLDLSSRRVAQWCVLVGAVLVVAAWGLSQFLLYPLGGLRRLRREVPPSVSDEEILWVPYNWDFESAWWYALRAPHSDTPLAMLIAIGSAVAVFGLVLLLGRSAAAVRLLTPLRAAGSMILTLYCAHIVVLATGLFDEQPGVQFVVILVAMLAFATWWRARHNRGPLEELITRTVAWVQGRWSLRAS